MDAISPSLLRKPLWGMARRTEFTWRYLVNGRSALRYLLESERPTGIAGRVALDLGRDGIAFTPSEALSDRDSLQELKEAIAGLERSKAGELARARTGMDAPERKSQKAFAISLLPAERALDRESIFVRFALQSSIRKIVNHYFGMYVSLVHTNVWHTLVAPGLASQSQLWHRDPEDRHILKLFLYLTDVGRGSGPLTYAVGSHRQPYRMASCSRPGGEIPRSTDAQMSKLVPPERWLTATVPKGTVVFADTRGYHKGGLARERERIAYIAEYLPRRGRGISTV